MRTENKMDSPKRKEAYARMPLRLQKLVRSKKLKPVDVYFWTCLRNLQQLEEGKLAMSVKQMACRFGLPEGTAKDSVSRLYYADWLWVSGTEKRRIYSALTPEEKSQKKERDEGSMVEIQPYRMAEIQPNYGRNTTIPKHSPYTCSRASEKETLSKETQHAAAGVHGEPQEQEIENSSSSIQDSQIQEIEEYRRRRLREVHPDIAAVAVYMTCDETDRAQAAKFFSLGGTLAQAELAVERIIEAPVFAGKDGRPRTKVRLKTIFANAEEALAAAIGREAFAAQQATEDPIPKLRETAERKIADLPGFIERLQRDSVIGSARLEELGERYLKGLIQQANYEREYASN